MSDELIEIEEEEFTSQLTTPVMKRIGGLLKPHWSWVVGFLLAIALTSALDAYFTFLNKQIIDQGIVMGDSERVMQIAIIYACFIFVQSAAVFTFIYLAGVLGERIQYDLRKMLFNHLQDLSLSYYAQNAVGRMIARVTSDTGRVSDLLTWGLVDSTWAIMNITMSLIFMLIINWRLALIVMTIIPIMVVIAVEFRKRILANYRLSRRANSKITGAFNENFQGTRVVKALGREDENTREFQGLTTNMYHASYRAAWLSALFLPVVQMIAAVALGVIVGYGGMQIEFGTMTIGGMTGFRGVSHVHDVAHSRPGARVFRNAEQHCVSGANFQVGRHPVRGPRQKRCRRSENSARRDRIRSRELLLRGQEIRFDRFLAEGESRRDDRAGRTDRRRQKHHREFTLPLLRADRRRDPHQRHGLYGLQAGVDPQQDRHRAANPSPLLWDRAREYPLRTFVCGRCASGGSRQDRGRA